MNSDYEEMVKIPLSVFMIIGTTITYGLRTHIYKWWANTIGLDRKKFENTWTETFHLGLINGIVLGSLYILFLSFDLIQF